MTFPPVLPLHGLPLTQAFPGAPKHVAKEFFAQGPTERAAFRELSFTSHSIGPATSYWPAFGQLRGATASTKDLALAMTKAASREFLPFVTFDRGATRASAPHGVVTLDFLDTLAWLVHCGRLDVEGADAIEASARAVDGWRPPAGYPGTIDDVRAARVAAFVRHVGARQGRA